jgi:uracil-DNA glycosylase
MLTVERNNPGSHKKSGWQEFTDGVIQKISEKTQHKVFMLWGAFAQKKGELIDGEKHLVLEAAHPSPLAGNRYAGSAHFSKTNAYLKTNNQKIIEWKLD